MAARRQPRWLPPRLAFAAVALACTVGPRHVVCLSRTAAPAIAHVGGAPAPAAAAVSTANPAAVSAANPFAAPPGITAWDVPAAPPGEPRKLSVQPPEDAVVMKTWVFVKESMGQIRSEVSQLMSVKDDIASMKKDLHDQEALWAQAEVNAIEENKKMEADLEVLRQQIHDGDALRKEVQDLKAAVESEKNVAADTWSRLQAEEEGRDLLRQFYHRRAQNLTGQLQILNGTDKAESSKAHETQLQLETDTVALRLKEAELQDQMKHGQEQVSLQQESANAKTADLNRQLESMKDGLARVKAQLGMSDQADQQRELAKVQMQIQQEIAQMVQVKQEQAQVIGECARLKDTRRVIRTAEKEKAEKRDLEARQLCQPVHGQLAVLQMLLGQCQASRQAAEAPAGLMPGASSVVA